MSDIPYKNKIDPKTKAMVVIIVLLCAGLIVGLVVSKVSIDFAKSRMSERFENLGPQIQMLINTFIDMYTLGTSIICINIFLLLGLFFIYADSFRKTKSSFILGLLLFIGVLFVQSIISLPILHAAYGYTGYTISLFGVLPNMFETIALVILLYLSME